MIGCYMTDSLTLKTATLDTWGKASYTSTIIKVRFEYKTKLVRNIQGEQIVSTANVILTDRILTHADKIVYGGVEYSIISIGKAKDFSNKFLRIYLS